MRSRRVVAIVALPGQRGDRRGQLGRSSESVECDPGEIVECLGVDVTADACDHDHRIALTHVHDVHDRGFRLFSRRVRCVGDARSVFDCEALVAENRQVRES